MPPPPRHLPPPDLFSYQGPPNGDYVRYVEQLMAWAEQEHARTGTYVLPTTGVTAAAPITSVAQLKNSPSTRGQTGSAAQGDVVRQVMQMLEQSAKPPASTGAAAKTKQAAKRGGGVANVVFVAAMVAAVFYLEDAIPLVIIGFVIWNVVRLLRSVNRK